jgi:hypothetical protein
MKKAFLIFFIFLLGHVANAQKNVSIDQEKSSYAIIKDTDGYVNVRATPNINSAIAGRIYKYQIFLCEPNSTNWWKVEQIKHNSKTEYFLDGYLYKNRVSLITDVELAKEKSTLGNSYEFRTSDFLIRLSKKKFNPKEHKFTYSKPNPSQNIASELVKIDGKRFWGEDETIPKESISNIKITHNNTPILIPDSAFKDLYEPSFNTTSISNGPANAFYLLMTNSDGAGGYTVIWIFKDDKYYGRYIDDSLE